MTEPGAGWLAQVDQMKAGLRDMADMLGGYRDSLMEHGFERGEALELVNSFQVTLIATTRTDHGGLD